VSVPRWELLRALGAVADSEADAVAACGALGLPGPSGAEHTEVFVLNCPPYASVYLGAEGGVGGEAADRVAGFWRAIGLDSPSEPDHLAALLSLYAGLGEAAADSGQPATRRALAQTRGALLAEHLWPWLPSFLDAVADLSTPALPGWAALALRALRAERAALSGEPPWRAVGGTALLPLALRAAPPPLAAECLGSLLEGLTSPVRCGIILTRQRLAAGAAWGGTGHRIGERRFTLRAMLEQAPARTLAWLQAEAQRWHYRHAARAAGDPVYAWWAQRARHTSCLLSREAQAP
jgi:nitrate reductase delta subunit